MPRPEQARLQMVGEMSKRLGSNVSRFEVDQLRARCDSLSQEATRVQASNQELQARLQRAQQSEETAQGHRAEVGWRPPTPPPSAVASGGP